MYKYLTWNNIIQVLLVFFTIAGFLLTSLKLVKYGLILNLISQIFWLYSTYQSWKRADQIGAFINTIIITLILIYGVINYWLI